MATYDVKGDFKKTTTDYRMSIELKVTEILSIIDRQLKDEPYHYDIEAHASKYPNKDNYAYISIKNELSALRITYYDMDAIKISYAENHYKLGIKSNYKVLTPDMDMIPSLKKLWDCLESTNNFIFELHDSKPKPVKDTFVYTVSFTDTKSNMTAYKSFGDSRKNIPTIREGFKKATAILEFDTLSQEELMKKYDLVIRDYWDLEEAKKKDDLCEAFFEYIERSWGFAGLYLEKESADTCEVTADLCIIDDKIVLDTLETADIVQKPNIKKYKQ